MPHTFDAASLLTPLTPASREAPKPMPLHLADPGVTRYDHDAACIASLDSDGPAGHDALRLVDGWLTRGRLFYLCRAGTVTGPHLAEAVYASESGGWVLSHGRCWQEECFLTEKYAHLFAAGFWVKEERLARAAADRAALNASLAMARANGGAA